MKTKYFYYITLVIVAMSSCEEGEISEVNQARVVVEGFLHAGETAEVSLTKEVLFKESEDEKGELLDWLEVSLSDGDQTVMLTHTMNGRYVNETIVIDPAKHYTLSFDYHDQEINATTPIPASPKGLEASKSQIKAEPFSGGRPTNVSIETMELYWENPENDYYMVVIVSLEDDPKLINTSGFIFANFRSEPLITSSLELRSTDFVYYGDHAIILYRLNPEYASLYMDTGESSLNLSTPYSNITNGLGILTGLNSDTAYVHVYGD